MLKQRVPSCPALVPSLSGTGKLLNSNKLCNYLRLVPALLKKRNTRVPQPGRNTTDKVPSLQHCTSFVA